MGHGGDFLQNMVQQRREWQTLQYSWLENPMNSMNRQKDMKDELPRLVGAQYATEDQGRNNSRKNEETEPKQKQLPVVDVMEVKSDAVNNNISSVSSAAQSCPTLCYSMNCSTPGFPVHHQLPEHRNLEC